MGRVVRRLSSEFIVFQHSFDDVFMFIGNKIKFQANIEVFRAEILVTPHNAYGQSETCSVYPGQLRQLDGYGEFLLDLQRFISDDHCADEIEVSKVANQFAPI